ncbi:uncharacterized protein LOC128552793 [Mercenaria mercenaria]|uniref:uncharacterized protein LOC128552793 n=1 Tax=Mercenaria mercenaria TaxID=6596 RepID=UPI00234F189D|nr:uncharacterized protein LOC128552793 [Mercenaria mercenaria]
MDKFNDIITAINSRCVMKKLQLGKCVRNYMEMADIKFTALDAQIEARRLKYDTSLTDSEVFVQMEKVIKFTSDPTVSSMTYLARLGSALSMKTTLDNGLVYLQYAREHSERVLPCKDTGMVYYIEINLLSQKYEQNPTEEMKKEVIKTTERAIAQFSNEADDIRKDYERMLMLKMAYCYLGLSLFGKRINDVKVSDGDRQSAKKCNDFIEIPDIWERMESRRKMLYHIAKAEYYRQEMVHDLSLLNAKEAERFAQENKWTAELPNILDLIEVLEANSQNDVNDEQLADDIVQRLLEDVADDGD